VFDAWAPEIRALARRRNTYMKLGGFGISRLGWSFSKESLPPSSDELAALWGPYVETCLESFGPRRAMFESNFPVDKAICSMNVLLNAYKKMVAACSAAEQAAIFFETAARVYRVT
jgi:predicted TIM-barrel fold metal-dependent hydrolase